MHEDGVQGICRGFAAQAPSASRRHTPDNAGDAPAWTTIWTKLMADIGSFSIFVALVFWYVLASCMAPG